MRWQRGGIALCFFGFSIGSRSRKTDDRAALRILADQDDDALMGAEAALSADGK